MGRKHIRVAAEAGRMHEERDLEMGANRREQMCRF
jgi:hypothetical protein